MQVKDYLRYCEDIGMFATDRPINSISLSSLLSTTALSSDNLDTLKEIPRHSKPEEIAALMGFKYIHWRSQSGDGRYFNVNLKSGYTSHISEYDYLIDFSIDPGHPDSVAVAGIGDDTCVIQFDRDESILQISFYNSSRTAAFSMTERLSEIARLHKPGDAPLEEMTFLVSGDNIKAIVILHQISGIYDENELQEINSLAGLLLIRLF